MRSLRQAWGVLRRPALIASRLRAEARGLGERWRAPRRLAAFDERALLAAAEATDIASLWARLASQPWPFLSSGLEPGALASPGERTRVMAAADAALAHRVDLLGSGPVDLGQRIDWSRDFKSGLGWPRRFMRDIQLVRRADRSDVKLPWELSRLQWLLPAGQAYLLTGDERYAAGVATLLDDWIEANPYCASVNWTVAMESGLRILTWTWLFHVFGRTAAWQGAGFRSRFLRALYLHGEFTERHLECAGVSFNHCTAGAAGLVFAGAFFGQGQAARRWQEHGFALLCRELPRQVHADGVDFEASVAYHRLVLELFLLPALLVAAGGRAIPDTYRERLIAMAHFSAAYSRPDGSVPLWGDADDGRALPLGGQELGDHSYLAGLVGVAFDVADLREASAGDRSEVFWLLGPQAAASLPERSTPSRGTGSRAFAEGGVFILRNAVDHVFVDCGPVGMAGLGGHGHNDCLSFEAALLGVALVSDCGSYVYTADATERNRFRATAAHNTPIVDGAEINRLFPDLLWTLEDDARPELRRFETGSSVDTFCGAHSGYRRLAEPLVPVRTLVLDHQRHELLIRDEFEGGGRHRFEVPYHLAPGVEARRERPGYLTLGASGRRFSMSWEPADAWSVELGHGRVSPRYGVAVPITRVSFRREGPAEPGLCVRIAPLLADPATG